MAQVLWKVEVDWAARVLRETTGLIKGTGTSMVNETLDASFPTELDDALKQLGDAAREVRQAIDKLMEIGLWRIKGGQEALERQRTA